MGVGAGKGEGDRKCSGMDGKGSGIEEMKLAAIQYRDIRLRSGRGGGLLGRQVGSH